MKATTISILNLKNQEAAGESLVHFHIRPLKSPTNLHYTGAHPFGQITSTQQRSNQLGSNQIQDMNALKTANCYWKLLHQGKY